jgi:hypothetical protein
MLPFCYLLRMSVAELYVRLQDIERANRAEIREVADLYFARFEATLEKGLARLRGDMAAQWIRRHCEVAAQRPDLRSELAGQGANLRSEMAAQRADLIKWMFIFWAGTVIPLAGLAIALSRF